MVAEGQQQLRRRLLAIGAVLGSIVSIFLALSNSFSFVGISTLICSIGWLILASLFQFSRIPLRALEVTAFVLLCSQHIIADLLYIVLTPFTGVGLFSEFSGDLWVTTIIILLSFLCFTRKQALILTLGLISLSISVVIFRATNLVDGDISSVLKLIKHTAYFLVCLYLIHTLSLFRNVAHNAQTEAKEFEKLAFFDELTGIANRRNLTEVLAKEVANAKRYQSSLSIVMFDIDHFKRVNDTYGHNIGDLVLKEVSNSVANTIRSGDSFGRWGGEEFLCILPNTDANFTFQLAERLRLGIADSLIDDGPAITASFGIAQLNNLDTLESFINRADQALYSAKEQGRNRCKPNPLKETSEVYITSKQTNHLVN